MIKSHTLFFLFSIALIGSAGFTMEVDNQADNNCKKILLKLGLLLNKELIIIGVSKVAGDTTSDQLRGKHIAEMDELNHLQPEQTAMILGGLETIQQERCKSSYRFCLPGGDITKLKMYPYDQESGEILIGVHIKRFYVGLLARLMQRPPILLSSQILPLPTQTSLGKLGEMLDQYELDPFALSFREFLENNVRGTQGADPFERLMQQEMMDQSDDSF